MAVMTLCTIDASTSYHFLPQTRYPSEQEDPSPISDQPKISIQRIETGTLELLACPYNKAVAGRLGTVVEQFRPTHTAAGAGPSEAKRRSEQHRTRMRGIFCVGCPYSRPTASLRRGIFLVDGTPGCALLQGVSRAAPPGAWPQVSTLLFEQSTAMRFPPVVSNLVWCGVVFFSGQKRSNPRPVRVRQLTLCPFKCRPRLAVVAVAGAADEKGR